MLIAVVVAEVESGVEENGGGAPEPGAFEGDIVGVIESVGSPVVPPSIVSFVRVDADDLLPDKGDVWGQREAAQKRERGVMNRRLRYPYR